MVGIALSLLMLAAGASRAMAQQAETESARVLAVGSLVDRSVGDVDFGVPRRSLLRLEVPTYPAESCPLCAAGSRPVKPGSRA